MSVSDFFIRGRQFFGFLLPGIVWGLSVIILLNYEKDPVNLIVNSNIITVQAIWFVGVSYLLGLSLQFFSMPFAEYFSAKVYNRRPSPTLEKRLKKLEAKVTDYLKNTYEKQTVFIMPESQQLFAFCKRFLRENSVALGKELDVYEEEINVCGLLPLPLFVFTIVWSASSATHGRIAQLIVGVLIALIPLVFCLFNLERVKLYERIEGYESFLLTQLETRAPAASSGSK